MKVATLEKFHLRGGENQGPGDPGVEKVRGGGFFFLQAGGGGGGGTDTGRHYDLRVNLKMKTKTHFSWKFSKVIL